MEENELSGVLEGARESRVKVALGPSLIYSRGKARQLDLMLGCAAYRITMRLCLGF